MSVAGPKLTFSCEQDQNRSPYIGAPLIDTKRLLEFVRFDGVDVREEELVFPLPFSVPTMENPFLAVDTKASSSDEGMPVACTDFVLASRGATSERCYALMVGDSQDGEIMGLFFLPKTRTSGDKKGMERVDYRLFKKAKTAETSSAN